MPKPCLKVGGSRCNSGPLSLVFFLASTAFNTIKNFRTILPLLVDSKMKSGWMKQLPLSSVTLLFSHSAYLVMRHLQRLQVGTCWVGCRKEAGSYPIRRKRQGGPIENLFFSFLTNIQHLVRAKNKVGKSLNIYHEPKAAICIAVPLIYLFYIIKVMCQPSLKTKYPEFEHCAPVANKLTPACLNCCHALWHRAGLHIQQSDVLLQTTSEG